MPMTIETFAKRAGAAITTFGAVMNRLGRTLSVIIALACFIPVAAEPLVKIPRITEEKAAELSAAGTFLEDDWYGAAVVRTFSSCTGKGKIAQPTTFYLFHDGENLWLAAYCAEDDFSQAYAFERPSNDDITVDESVQVVIGLDDKVAGQLNMGGYEGAVADLGKCAHTYEMTVNLAGSATRRYDETPLADSKFDCALYDTGDGWAAVFRIPFASVGYDWIKAPLTYFNLFRFYRGERYGWHLPSFGGYNQLPMAKAEFLDFDRNDEATTEDFPELPASADAGALPVPVLGRLDLEYYPAAGEVAAEVPSGRKGQDIALTVNGVSVRAEGSSHWPTRLKLPADFPAGTKITAAVSCNGSVLVKKEFTAKAPADWRMDVAREYLDDRVPYPWISPEFEDGVLTLKHGTVDFGDGMLPVSAVSSRGREILAGPVTLEFEISGETLPVNGRADFRRTVTAVDMLSADYPGVEVKTHAEYDGFMTVRARVTGLGETVPDTLRLRIPLAEGLAQYMTSGNSQSLLKIGGCGYRGNIKDDLWVGDRDGGVIFTFGHYLIYSAPNGRQVEINGDEIVLTLVSPDGIRPPEDNVFEFHLQFTPFRDDYIPPLSAELMFESWSDYQSYPDLKKAPEVKKRVEAARAAGKDLYLYFGQTMAENAPEFAQYPTDFTAYPRRPWYKRAYDPGKDVPCSVICFRGEAGEFMLDRIEKLADETGLRGVYLDGPSVPFWCLNLNHPCSIFLPAEWDGSWHEGCVAGQRSYMKRLRGIFDSRGVKNPIWHHTGGGFSLVHFSHCDFYLDGETLSRYRRGYLLPPDVTSVVYSGYSFGFQGVLWASAFVDATFTLPFRRANIWSLPHGMVTSMVNGANWSPFLDITKRNPDARFYPYTGEQPHIKTLVENSLCTSYYLAENEAVLISGNIVYEGVQENAVDISGMFPGQELQVRCLNRDEPLDFRDGILKYSVATRDMRIYFIAPVSTDASGLNLPDPVRARAEVAPAAPLEAQNDFEASNWVVEAGTLAAIPESGLKHGLKPVNKKGLLRYRDTLPDNVNIKLKFRHPGNFKFHIDGVEISNKFHTTNAGIYHWGGWVIENVDSNDTTDSCDVSPGAFGRNYVVNDRPVDVDIYLVDGRISMFYDGVRVLQNALPAKDYGGNHTFAVEVKDDSWIAFDLEYLGPCAREDVPVWIHPIL